MKAIVHTAYGERAVLELADVAKPEVEEGKVVVRVMAASVNPLDWHLMRGLILMRPLTGIFKPKSGRIGSDIAGVIDAVGKGVTNFKPGDEVFGVSSPWAGFAEYTVTPARGLAHKPKNMSFAEAAALPIAAITALQSLRDDCQLKAGQQILINGASGGVGTYAVQMAKAMGAEVTAVCSTRNVELVRSLGADRVIDYKKEDFTINDAGYDAIADMIGNRSFTELSRILRANGTCSMIGFSPSLMLAIPIRGPILKWRSGKRFNIFSAKTTAEDLNVLRQMAEAEQIRSIIDRTYPLAEADDAMSYLGSKRIRGKVVLEIE